MKDRKNVFKERRLKRKQEQAAIGESKANVIAANELADPLDSVAPFKKFNRNGLNVQISFRLAKDLPKDTFEWIFGLTEQNMKEIYEQSSWGWDGDEKREELSEDDARFLIVQSIDDENSPKNVAFVHFRYDMDFNVDVLYCYEIQLEKDVQRKGLGKFLMQILQLLAFHSKMKKVVLTVFHKNEAAYNFYHKCLKYSLDETSPEDEADYVILSKPVKQKSS